MDISATPSQEEEKIHDSKNQQETLPESEAKCSLLSSAASKQVFPPFFWFVCIASLWPPQEEHQIIFNI